MQVEPLRPEYHDRDARVAVMDEQGLGAALLFPTLGCGVEEALRDDIPATMASLVGVQPLARGGLGLRLPGPPLRRADALARRPRRRASPRSTRCSSAAPASCTSARRPVPGAQRHQPLARRQAARPGVGPARRGRRPGRLPPRRQRLQARFASAWGGRGDFGFGKSDAARPRAGRRTGRSTTRSRRSSSTACSQRHPTLRVASIENGSDWVRAAREAPAQAGQPDAVGVRRGPARHASAATCGSRRTSRRTCARWPT